MDTGILKTIILTKQMHGKNKDGGIRLFGEHRVAGRLCRVPFTGTQDDTLSTSGKMYL